MCMIRPAASPQTSVRSPPPRRRPTTVDDATLPHFPPHCHVDWAAEPAILPLFKEPLGIGVPALSTPALKTRFPSSSSISRSQTTGPHLKRPSRPPREPENGVVSAAEVGVTLQCYNDGTRRPYILQGMRKRSPRRHIGRKSLRRSPISLLASRLPGCRLALPFWRWDSAFV